MENMGGALEDSVQKPLLHKTYIRPDSISQLQRIDLFTMIY